jgi:gliding motility-associated-like protein
MRFLYISVVVALIGFSTNVQAQISTGTPPPEVQLDDCIPFIANAFTPNGDNRNDLFGVKINPRCNLVDFRMQIADRWGRKIFDVDNHREAFWWDGTWDGTLLPSGVYFYQITARFDPPSGAETQLINRSGTVTLIR